MDIKNRVIRTFTVTCFGLLLLFGGVNSSELSTKVILSTANSGASQLMNVNIAQNSKAYEVASMTASSDTAITGSANSFGYNNLGIAVVDGNLNVRESANETSNLMGKMPNNSACEILGYEGDWASITSGDVSGYVLSSYLITGDTALIKAKELIFDVASIHGDSVNVRKEPSTDSEIIGHMNSGNTLEVENTNFPGWVTINVDGETGYVSSDFVTITTQLPTAITMDEVRYGAGVSENRVDLVNYATQFVGNPYVWGGTSLTNGADCSGFVLSIYSKYGISLPHSSSGQSQYGTRISSSEAEPGDLFFYGSGRSISHVAIYIGNGQIVHASSKKTGIKISNAFYRNPICAVRLMN